MISRATGYLSVTEGDVPLESVHLQAEGWTMLRGVLAPTDVAQLRSEIDGVFDELPADRRNPRAPDEHWASFRYEMLNRSAACQRAVGHSAILAVIEPLLGEDCHVIANTAWRQPPEPDRHGGRAWHIDAGPHVPRPAGVGWDERIPYPIFAIAAHLLLIDCPLEAGPTGVLAGSHTSGLAPPRERRDDPELTWEGRRAVPLVGSAGDVALFVSDVWHRRLPSEPDNPGRYFLQVHYGRRDLAQRLRPTDHANQLSEAAIARASTPRERSVVGLHPTGFYDG